MPTTNEGWAALLDFLATDPHGRDPSGYALPLCANAGDDNPGDDGRQDAIIAALTSTAAMLRTLAATQA